MDVIGLWREHLLQNLKSSGERRRADSTEPPGHTLAVDGTDLVENNVPRLALKPAGNTKWVRVSARGQRCNNVRADVSVQIVRGYNEARPCFPDLASPRRIELHENNIAAT